MSVKSIRLVIWSLVLVGAVGLLLVTMNKPSGGRPAELPLAGKGSVRDFDLLAHTGERLKSADLNGKYRLMYFGYTFCPDKCPLDLAKMTLALAKLETSNVPLDNLQPLFVTIDPERDTQEAMADTVGLYHEKLVGLTGTPQEIAEVANTFGVYYKKLEEEGFDSYLMDHMVVIFLYDQDGRYVTMFTEADSADSIAATLTPLLKGA